MIHTIRKFQLEILDEVIDIIEKHKLVYSLEGGTLLGCLVNEGFGEFDDDIDIVMPRKDYEKLVEIFSRAIRSDIYAEEQRLIKGYHLVFMKIRKKDNYYKLNDFEQKKEIFIDIFPLDYYSSEKKLSLNFQLFFVQKLKAIIFLKKRTIVTQDTRLKKMKQIAVKLFVPISANVAYKLFRMIVIGKESKFLFNYSGKMNKKRNGNIPHCINDYFPLKYGLFEDKMYKIPSKPQKIIENIYGPEGIESYIKKNKFNHI